MFDTCTSPRPACLAKAGLGLQGLRLIHPALPCPAPSSQKQADEAAAERAAADERFQGLSAELEQERSRIQAMEVR